MNSLLEKKLITTKAAGILSGYTPDYLARLVRSEKIVGHRIGHSWLVDKESLENFLAKQEDRKIDRSRVLTQAREEEYRAHRSSALRNEEEAKPYVWPQVEIRKSPAYTQFFAMAVALLVVAGGALVAQAASSSPLTSQAVAMAQEAASGFSATFGTIPDSIAARIEVAGTALSGEQVRIAAKTALASAQIAPPALANPDLSFARMTLPEGDRFQFALHATASPAVPDAPLLTPQKILSSVLDTYAFLTTPSRIVSTLVDSYVALGTGTYDAITASFAGYRSLVLRSGAVALALGTASRDALVAAPHRIAICATALGQSVVNASHAAIGADVALAYGISAAAPATARATVAFVGDVGSVLGGATAHVPALATTAYLKATAAPAVLAPALAQAVFSAEYGAATRFVALGKEVSRQYLALVSDTGRFVYEGVAGTRTLASVIHSSVSGMSWSGVGSVPAALENAYLGLLGKSSLALDSFGASLVSPNSAPSLALAAALPTLSTGEQTALFTYQTINGLFSSATRAIAGLFGTSSNVAVVPNPSPSVLFFATSTTSIGQPPLPPPPPPSAPSAPRRITVTSYPTYTTVVKGVSQDFVNQSLAQLRGDILATVAGMIQPVAAQSATNVTSIQQVNMIQDLSNLTVRNGSFLGGTFDKGNVTNGISVSAVTGHFDNLTGGSATLATTSITGSLTTTGDATFGGSLTAGSLAVSSLSSSGALTAPYFTATSTTATSTFGGRFAVGTSSPYGNGLFTVGTTSPLLYVDNSTGHVGIGTSSPGFALDVNGIVNASSLYVNGAPYIGSQWTTASSSIYYATGNVGIGTTSPGSLLSIGSTNGINFSTATSTFNSTGGINLTSGCFAINGFCTGNGNGTVTSVALTTPTGLTVTGSPITTSGTLALSLQSGYNIPLTASTTNWNTAYNEAVSSWTSPLQYSNGVASILQSSASQNGYLSSTDWSTFNSKQAALSFTYPLVNSANVISTAFGTTTANSFNQLQQFNANASTTQLTVTGNTYFPNGIWNASGNVGIGTTSPGSLLSIGSTNGINFSTATSTFNSTGGINL
ncbi:MAG: hypothetical protein ACYC1Y_03760, partial [Minisyncoccota bacterium]